MTKNLLLFWLSFVFIGNLFAQQTVFQVQGVPRPDIVITPQDNSPGIAKVQEENTFSFDDIEFWVGEGENKAMMVVDWYDDKGPALVWGYRWEGSATGANMVMAIAAADPRFSCMTGMGTIGGLGYDINNSGLTCVTSTASTQCPINGLITVMNYRYDGWSGEDPAAHWQSGWMSGYWNYQVKSDIKDEFGYSSLGAGSRRLTNGCVDAWTFQTNMGGSQTGLLPRAPFVAAPTPDTKSTFNDIEYWIGSGSNETAIVIQWNDGKENDALVWGYRWDGEITVMQALKDIAYTDERLFLVVDENDFIVGIAFDLNGKNIQSVIYNDDTIYPGYPVDGLLVIASSRNLDLYKNSDPEDHWNAGQVTNGIWTYLTGESSSNFTLSEKDYREQLLSAGSWNALNFDLNFEHPTIKDELTPVSEYIWEEIDYTKGIFFVNEDWFGWRNGSVNFLTEEGKWVYRAYSRENRGQAFGYTTSYGTIYGDNFYFVSKQAFDSGDKQYEPGGRLVVADSKTLKKKASFDEIGGGDGRAFLGVDENTGYISTSSGIVTFDIPTLTVGKKVSGTEGGSAYAGQIGTMLHIGDYVFACKQSNGVLVIDAKKHEAVTLIECKNIGTIVRSKDGYLWATAYSDGLWKIDPYTFEVLEKREIPTEALIPGSWGAWSASLICASDKTNTLFWAKMNGSSMTFFGTKVYRYDIDNPDLSQPFYELTRTNEAFYGSGINIDPVTENLVITTTQTGYLGNYQYHWVHFVNSETGQLIEIKPLDLYYWFPTMSTFPDNYPPVIADELSQLSINARTEISLLDKVTDADNSNGAIIKQIEVLEGAEQIRVSLERENLILQPLSKTPARLKLTANSNGKIVSQEIEVNVTEFTSVQSIELDKNQIEISPRETYQLIATVYPENASNKTVLWSSSNELAATVDENGIIQPLQSGKTVTITAGTEDRREIAVCTVTISPVSVTGMVLDTQEATLDAGTKETLQLTARFTPEDATNQNVNWSSSNPEIVSVDENGLVTALQEGQATITGTSEDGNFEASCEITTHISVQVARLDIASGLNMQVGTTYQASVIIKPENATNKNIKEWTSSNPAVVSVDENGLITAIEAGSGITISAILEDGDKIASARVNSRYVVEEVSLTPERSYLPIGKELRLDAIILPENAYTKVVSWASSDEEIATVDNMWGMVYTYTTVKAIAEGEATITVTTYSESKTATATIICVIPVEEVSIQSETTEVMIGETIQLNAAIYPENATIKNVNWESSDPEKATIDENGVVTALKEGEVIITVTTEEGEKTATVTIVCKVASVESVSITPEDSEILIGETVQLSAVILPENATNKNVSWTSTNPEIATVNDSGLVTALVEGEVTITVTTEDGEKTAFVIITCKAIAVESVSLTPESSKLEIGEQLQLLVTIVPENAANKNIQSWVSSKPEVASVDIKGLVVALAGGQTTITVTTEDQQLEASCEIVVSPANNIEETFVISTLVYPAITTGEIIVEQQELNRITIQNVQGVPLQTITPQQNKEAIEMSGYSTGIYFITIGDKTFKVIKK